MKRYCTKRIYFIAAFWMLVIFATSSTFIPRSNFVDFVRRFIPSSGAQNAWLSFWQICGFFIVKTYHFGEFALLCFLLFHVLKRFTRKAKWALMAAVSASALVALSWRRASPPL